MNVLMFTEGQGHILRPRPLLLSYDLDFVSLTSRLCPLFAHDLIKHFDPEQHTGIYAPPPYDWEEHFVFGSVICIIVVVICVINCDHNNF